MALIELAADRVGYDGRSVLANVSIAIERGERVAILGRSGAGKSTLLSLLYRNLIADSIDVALVPQDHALVPALSVYHNIYMGQLDKRGAVYSLVNLVRPWPAERKLVGEIAAPLGLSDILDQSVGTLSGGQQQRTAVGRAMFRGGEAIIADEPFSAVDGQQARSILRVLSGEFPTSVMAMHDVDLAFEFATRLIGLKNGRVAWDHGCDAVDKAEVSELYRH